MGASSSSLLDESKISYIRGRTEAELKNFTPHYKRQSCVAFFSYLKDEVEQHRSGQAQLLKQKEPLQATEVLYKDSMLYFDDNRKWRERFVVVCADYSLELHDSQETFTKGTPARHKLLPTGGAVLTSEEKYNAVVDKVLPDPNGCKEESSVPLVVVPGPLPVYLRLPYRRDYYFCFQQEEKRARFVSILNDCIRHQNQDYLKSMTCEVQAFLKAIHFYRQEKGLYESWDMLVGTELQVLAYLVMEELLPSLQTELLPKLKGKKPERKRVWFATVEATYELVQEQLREGLESLKNECRDATKQQEALIRSDMDQIINSQTFLEMKLQAFVSEPAMKYSSESVAPYLASILEELMGPVSTGFQAVRLLLEDELTRFCKDFPQGGLTEEFQTALEQVGRDRMEDCYQHVNVLKEQLQELRNRFKFSNSTRIVHCTQGQMQQLMENAVYTFKMLLQSALMDKPDNQASVMEKAKLRVLKQFDYDSSTVRKKIFQEALVDITLPAIRRKLDPGCKTELQNYEQFVFADYTNFVQVENVYENILLNILNNEVNKVVKEAASLKKNNLFADSTDLYCVSQSSLADNRTPPLSAPSSPPKVLASVALSQQAGQKTISTLGETIIEETHQTHDTSVIPVVKITVSSPESLEPTLPSSIAETGQPDVPPTIPNISSPALKGSSTSDAITVTSDTSTPNPKISETNAGSNTSDALTTRPETILSTEDSSLSGPEKLSSEVQDGATEEPLSDGQCSSSSASSSVSSDRAVYLNSTVVLKTGSPVPLAETSETVTVEAPLCVIAATDEDNKDAVPQSEIQPDSTPKINENIETPGDAIASYENTVNNRACDVVPPSVENRSEEKDTSHVDISTLDSVPDVPVGSAVALTSELENQRDRSTNSPEQDCAAGNEDTEDTADSVKAIKDLIMEVIEVEDIVRPCVEN
ncbi:protein Niban 1-like isoform X2 [Myxocyprinus asiaticus]|uniref:protein Niban 1-like isoform X2 n=1 Tax=Myxocyprinus asiaticus TaxID=70543 RepID=UPI0022235BD1|nr:protein Niban 1-like isoform X2 [Myxocyprinus asiaticus]